MGTIPSGSDGDGARNKLTGYDRDAMDQLGLKRYCCRRMIMTHVDLIEKLLKYVAGPLNPCLNFSESTEKSRPTFSAYMKDCVLDGETAKDSGRYTSSASPDILYSLIGTLLTDATRRRTSCTKTSRLRQEHTKTISWFICMALRILCFSTNTQTLVRWRLYADRWASDRVVQKRGCYRNMVREEHGLEGAAKSTYHCKAKMARSRHGETIRFHHYS